MENSNRANEKIIANNANTARDEQHIQNIEAQESYSLRIIEHAVKTGTEHDDKDVDDKQSEGSLPERLQAVNVSGGNESGVEKFLIFMSYLMFILLFPMSLCCMFLVARQFERVVILRNGKVYKNKSFGPGLIHYLPCVDVVKFIDLRISCYAVPPQEALTKDSLTVNVDAVVYYQIYRPIWAVINVTDFRSSTQLLAATTLRNAIGIQKLSTLLVNRSSISNMMYQDMKCIAREWGIQIIKVELKDISLPVPLQKAMAAEAESTRMANAKIIVAQAEIESTKSLKAATEILMDNPYCMQLRYLQSLHMISGEKTHTYVVPFSVKAIKKILKCP